MNTLKTYLVEDSPVIRESLIATLEELVPVLVVGTAEDEASATRWLSQPANQADLVIVDIFLKGGSGLGVLKAAREQHGQRHLVVLSNYATADMRRQCLELGAAKVFDKSNDIDALMDYCSQLAEGGASQKAGAGPLGAAATAGSPDSFPQQHVAPADRRDGGGNGPAGNGHHSGNHHGANGHTNGHNNSHARKPAEGFYWGTASTRGAANGAGSQRMPQ